MVSGCAAGAYGLKSTWVKEEGAIRLRAAVRRANNHRVPGNRERRRPGHFRICGKCGKRNKSRRVECSRCQEPLRGIPEAIPGKASGPPPPPRQYRWLVAAAIVVAIGAGFVIHRLFRTSTIAPVGLAVSSPEPPEDTSSLPTAPPTMDPPTRERYAQARSAVDRAERLLARREFRGAASILADTVRLVPEDARVANAYGRALLGLGSRDRALHQFERAARLDTGVAAFRVDYARALAAAGRNREAAREYEAVHALEPGNVAASEGLLRIQQGQPGGSDGTGVDLGGAPAAGGAAPAGGAFTNEDLARGVRPMRPIAPTAAPVALSTPSPRPLSVTTPSARPLSVTTPSPRAAGPSPSASPYTGPFASPAPDP